MLGAENLVAFHGCSTATIAAGTLNFFAKQHAWAPFTDIGREEHWFTTLIGLITGIIQHSSFECYHYFSSNKVCEKEKRSSGDNQPIKRNRNHLRIFKKNRLNQIAKKHGQNNL